jgi:hypothetical protein
MRLAAVLGLCFWLSLDSAHSADPVVQCSAALRGPRLVVSNHLSEPPVDRSKSMSELSLMSGGHYAGATLGLTLYRPSVEARRAPREVLLSGGQLCASRALELRVGLEDFRVYIAKEVPEGSCLDSEVIAHEALHVSRFKQDHQRLVEALEGVARQWTGQSAWVGPPEVLRPWLDAQPLPSFKTIAQAHVQETKRNHLLIDSDEEYRRLGASCRGAAGALHLKTRR